MKDSLFIQVNHRFGESRSLSVEVTVPASGTLGVFGPSGAGKTTLLRVLAGLQRSGGDNRVVFRGVTWEDANSFVPPHERHIGYVPQQPSLFPHLSVAENIRYGSKRAGAKLDINNIAQVLEIDRLMQRSVVSLSGGEQQRVALARALASAPQLLLLDEPLSALDAPLKREILPLLTRIKSEYGIPMVYVTHATEELAQLADHLLVVADGRLQASGPVAEVFPSMAGLGEARLEVLLEGQVGEILPEWQLVKFLFAGGELLLPDQGLTTGERIRVRIQARDVSLTLQAESETSILNRIPANVVSIEPGPEPAMLLVAAEVRNDLVSTTIYCQVTAKSAHDLQIEPGTNLHLQIKSVAILG